MKQSCVVVVLLIFLYLIVDWLVVELESKTRYVALRLDYLNNLRPLVAFVPRPLFLIPNAKNLKEKLTTILNQLVTETILLRLSF